LALQNLGQADREGNHLSHSRSARFPEWYRYAPDGWVSGIFHRGAAPTGPRLRSPEAAVQLAQEAVQQGLLLVREHGEAFRHEILVGRDDLLEKLAPLWG